LPPEEQRYADPASMLPYLTLYSAFNLLSWRTKLVNGRRDYDQIIVREFYNEPKEFGFEQQVREIVHDLDSERYYRVRVIKRPDDGKRYLERTIYPSSGREKLRWIPAVIISSEGLSGDIVKPMFLDLVDATLGHFLFLEPMNKMRGCLRSSDGVRCMMLATGNPGGPGHNLVKQRYVDPAPGGYVPLTDPETGDIQGQRMKPFKS
jgi:hypothetical protein